MENLGLWMLTGALATVSMLVWILNRKGWVTKDSFLVANWRVTALVGAITITATWTQAPALLFSGSQMFQSYISFGSFFIPNMLALPLAAVLVVGIRQVLPCGYNIPQFMGERVGNKTRVLAFLLSFFTLVVAVAYTVVGMKLWLVPRFGISTWMIIGALEFAAILWVIHTGQPGAIIVDKVKVALIGAGVVGVYFLFNAWPHGKTVTGGVPTDVPLGSWWTVWTMGVPLAASLLAGPIVNPDLGERFYVVDQRIARLSYETAAMLFAVIVLIFGALGLLAHTIGLPLTSTEIPAFSVLAATVSPEIMLLVTVGLAILLAAAIGSFVASAGNLLTIEVYVRLKKAATPRGVISVSRWVMFVPLIIGTYIASLDSVDIGVLLKALAVVRGEMIVPVLFAVFWPHKASDRQVFAGMLVGLFSGVGLTYGAVISNTWFGASLPFLGYHGAPLGALCAVFIPLAFILLGRGRTA